jgi:hypothetical protein
MFQGAPPPAGESFEFAGENLKTTLVESQKALSEFSNQILESFTQGRERIYEIQTAITDTVPGVRRLGGDIKDVASIISEVALESRRNVVATSEEVESLFVASKVLGVSAKEISKSFLDVGMSIESIPDTLNESMDYVQSIGGNAKTVMKDVSDNMAQMNRYQFEGGVQGLTKMAAKASMLRFEMKETFALAEKVLDPEGAIEVAGAFQRLGVAAGNLVDPFQLMNMSINDPSGLQDSLADVAKQFTEFDAETKTFKINPQGVLTLREMEKAAGLSAGSLSKMGLAASELDQRISAVNAAGLTIASEEDKQYLANIAKMDSKTKTYKVTLEDGTKKELSQLNQDEFNNLIQAQKDGPKTLEDTAREQLRLDEIIKNDIAAIRAVVVGGVLTAPTLQDLNETIREVTMEVGEAVSKEFSTKGVRTSAEDLLGNLKGNLQEIVKGGDFNPQTVFSKLMEGQTENLAKLGEEGKEKIMNISERVSATLLEKLAGIGNNVPTGQPISNNSGTNVSANTNTTTLGNISVLGQTGVNPNFTRGSVPTAPQKPIEVDGDIKVDVKFQNLPTSLTPEQIAEVIKTFNMAVNEQAFKNYIINVNRQQDPLSSQSFATY